MRATETSEQEWRAHALGLISELRQMGVIATSDIERAFLTVPRHAFVQAFYDSERGALKTRPENGPRLEEWLSHVYSNVALVTAVDDRGRARSSSTSPWLMAVMLSALELHPGLRLLEIGTGTGYNAALLGSAVGVAGSVHTIEIDPDLAHRARTSLESVGCRNVLVHVGDATERLAFPGLFDRVVVTAGFLRIAEGWWDRLVGDGILVGNLRGSLAGGVVVVRKQDRFGGLGRLLDTANVGFTPLIGEHTSLTAHVAATSGNLDSQKGISDFETRYLDPTEAGFRFLLQLEVPGAEVITRTTIERRITEFRDPSAGLAVRLDGEGQFEGSAALLGRLRLAFQQWDQLGRPQLKRFGIEVTSSSDQFIFVEGRDGDIARRWPQTGRSSAG